ncbi:MAG: hypothetical protein QM679_04115 [Patulibacter sp.]
MASSGLGYVSPLGHDDHWLARYLNGTVEPRKAWYGVERYRDLFHRRAINRRRVG